jgi:hypothetical protein
MTGKMARVLVLVSAVMGACSSSGGTSADASGGSSADASGMAGSGGRGGSNGGRGGSAGGTAGRGGNAGGYGGGCIRPVAAGVFGCAATYEEQATKLCDGGAATTGACGTWWRWECQSFFVQSCLYDSDKKLVAARGCDDIPNPMCGNSFCNESSPSIAELGLAHCVVHIPSVQGPPAP